MKILLILVVLVMPTIGRTQSDDLSTFYSEGISQDANAGKAQAEAFKDAVNKVVVQAATQLIGGARVEKNLGVMKSKVFPNWSKFVTSYKASDPKIKGPDTTVQVQMRVSLTSLRDLLASSGVLYQNDGKLNVIPLVKIVEKTDLESSFRWWVDDGTPGIAKQRESAKLMFQLLEASLKSKAIVFPEAVNKWVPGQIPDLYRRDFLSLDEMRSLGEYFKAQVILSGQLTYELTAQGYRTSFAVNGFNALNGRKILELNKSLEEKIKDPTLVKSLKKQVPVFSAELAARLADENSKGNLNVSTLLLVINTSLGPQELDLFKKQVLARVSELRTMRERRMERGQFSFEADVSGGATGLAKRLESISFEGLKVSQVRPGDDRVEFRLDKGR
ncbi:MAG: hypothetical protein IT289_05825 [Oligoflexia bacterium]|nr:hypothetical protein [Oligoflexia bacterium]